MSKPKTVQIIPFDEHFSYSQEGQYHDVGFAYAHLEGEKAKQLCGYFVCRDFLGDALFAEEQGKQAKIYGFSWTPSKQKIDRDKTRLLLQFSSLEMKKAMEKNLSILHGVEKDNDFTLTTLTDSDKDSELLVEGDSNWQASVVLISLYSFLLKCLTYDIKKVEDIVEKYEDSNEANLAQNTLKKLPKILKNLRRFGLDEESKKFTVTGTQDKSMTGTIHHYSGWHSVSAPASSCYQKNPYLKIVEEICG